MPIINEKEINAEVILQVAKQMAVSARTAPKARGNDNIEILIITGDTRKQLSEKMKEIGAAYSTPFFARDAENVMLAPVVMLLGTTIKSQGLKKCGMCGFANCTEKEKHPNHPCVFNTHDLGLAIGSAVSIASANHIDNRVMYTVGQAALELKIFKTDVKVALGIPLSATNKSPFFDRPAV